MAYMLTIWMQIVKTINKIDMHIIRLEFFFLWNAWLWIETFTNQNLLFAFIVDSISSIF